MVRHNYENKVDTITCIVCGKTRSTDWFPSNAPICSRCQSLGLRAIKPASTEPKVKPTPKLIDPEPKPETKDGKKSLLSRIFRR